MPLRNLSVIFLAAMISLACYQQAQRNRYASVVGEAMQLIDAHYLEDVDRRELFENAMSGMVGDLDQYSAYIAPEPLQEMEASLEQEFGGIGIEVEKPDKNGPILVLSPIVGTPAYRAGIYAGDAILAVDGLSTLGMDIKDALQKMRGKPGSPVQLQLLHAGSAAPIELTVVREVVMVDSVLGDVRRSDGAWDYHLAENARLGYLRVTTFGKRTAEELRRVLTEGRGNPQPFAALILDLRGNAGGLLDSAVEVCDLFLDEGVIVSTRDRNGEIRSSYAASKTNTAVPRGIPIAVLVNGTRPARAKSWRPACKITGALWSSVRGRGVRAPCRISSIWKAAAVP